MSFFTDFLLAGKKDAAQVAKTANPTEKWPGIPGKNLSCLDVAALYGVLLGKTTDDEIVDLEDDFESLECSQEAVELRLLPDRFLDLLAGVDPKKLRAVAKAWQAAENEVSQWTLEETQGALGELADLARRARKEKKPIMLCISGF